MSKLIDLSNAIQRPLNKSLFGMVQGSVERLLSIDRINHHHDLLHQTLFSGISDQSVFETVLDVLDVRFACDADEMGQIPADGPLVVIANHPFGGVEGVIMGAMLSRIRTDVRIMGNYLLKKIAGFGDHIFAVNPFENRQARDNLQGLKQCLSWVKNGGALVVFPAGEVASWHSKDGQVSDPDWSPHVAALIRITRATTLPVYFPGQNSALFSMAGMVSPRLRTMLLPRELENKTSRTFPMHIGRLRELTFRQVHEGTGRSVDLDDFDIHYHHLFLWNHDTSELVGGYRLGMVDRILRDFGRKGLYTNTLFRFKPEFLRFLTPAIEFGRSFIRSEYQKKFNSLIFIWRGVGEFISRNPHYKILFGPVSISRDYHSVSKDLMVRFLTKTQMHAELSSYVTPRRPYRASRFRLLKSAAVESAFRDIEDVSFLISEIEKDGKGVPVLLKHYLKLNGKLLSFSVDEGFSGVVDGLLMVDLRDTDTRLLRRWIKTKQFNSYYRLPDATKKQNHVHS
jgi:putative hemolysin